MSTVPHTLHFDAVDTYVILKRRVREIVQRYERYFNTHQKHSEDWPLVAISICQMCWTTAVKTWTKNVVDQERTQIGAGESILGRDEAEIFIAI
jgi:uncharacterized membrane protein